jgi:hypothetical protein
MEGFTKIYAPHVGGGSRCFRFHTELCRACKLVFFKLHIAQLNRNPSEHSIPEPKYEIDLNCECEAGKR